MPDTTPSPAPKSIDDQIRELDEKKAEKRKALRDEDKQNTFDCRKLESDQEGVLGLDFAIVDLAVRDKVTGEYLGRFGTPILLVRPDSSILHRQFVNGKVTEVATYDYVKAHVKSSVEEFKAIADARPSVVTRCADKLIELYGFAQEERAGKS